MTIQLLLNISSLASIYHKPPGSFLGAGKHKKFDASGAHVRYLSRTENQDMSMDLNPYGSNLSENPYSNDVNVIASAPRPGLHNQALNLVDLDLNEPEETFASNDMSQANAPTMVLGTDTNFLSDNLQRLGINDTFGLGQLRPDFLDAGVEGVYVPSKQMFLAASAAKGLEIKGTFARRQGQMVMELSFTNRALQPIGDFAMQINKNRCRLEILLRRMK
jgi:AP-1 complex subunit beta-1